MTNEDAKKMLKAKLECLKRETSGTDIDCNNKNCDECNLCYEQGNMGEQKEALELAIKALEQESKIGHWIVNKEKSLARCSNCKFLLKNKDEIKLFGTFIQGYNYCPYCGYRMIEPQESEDEE